MSSETYRYLITIAELPSVALAESLLGQVWTEISDEFLSTDLEVLVLVQRSLEFLQTSCSENKSENINMLNLYFHIQILKF